MTKQIAMSALQDEIISQNICPDLATSATQLVMGAGSLDADVVLIGEAPGKKEDETGQPFVGAAGRFLDVMLAEAGLSRDDVYITNIVKYRPPDNRDPSPEEKAVFLPYLLWQLEIIAPKAVITLGRHSMEYFLPDARISEVHGQPLRHTVQRPDGTPYTQTIIPLYHPAAALYNGRMRQALIDDFVAAVSAVNQG